MEMTLEKAHELGLAVTTVTLAQEGPYVSAMKSVGREVFAFNHELPTINGQKVVLRMVALGRRPGEGNIAKEMNKRSKTVRQFINEEENGLVGFDGDGKQVRTAVLPRSEAVLEAVKRSEENWQKMSRETL